mmetsp:Transcript_36298/g.114567  ORF Transcript_36298/g.114567 Transcript_36298/m.114567 type:complete len:202 (-) Transcript_36298:51-656(-)
MGGPFPTVHLLGSELQLPHRLGLHYLHRGQVYCRQHLLGDLSRGRGAVLCGTLQLPSGVVVAKAREEGGVQPGGNHRHSGRHGVPRGNAGGRELRPPHGGVSPHGHVHMPRHALPLCRAGLRARPGAQQQGHLCRPHRGLCGGYPRARARQTNAHGLLHGVPGRVPRARALPGRRPHHPAVHPLPPDRGPCRRCRPPGVTT